MAKSKKDGVKAQITEAKKTQARETRSRQPRKERQPAKPIEFNASAINTGRRRDVVIKAYEVQCTSPRGARQFVYRFDVRTTLDEAKTRSREFQQKYMKQGWSVKERAVLG